MKRISSIFQFIPLATVMINMVLRRSEKIFEIEEVRFPKEYDVKAGGNVYISDTAGIEYVPGKKLLLAPAFFDNRVMVNRLNMPE